MINKKVAILLIFFLTNMTFINANYIDILDDFDNKNKLNPDSYFYFLDRIEEDIMSLFNLKKETRINYNIGIMNERFFEIKTTDNLNKRQMNGLIREINIKAELIVSDLYELAKEGSFKDRYLVDTVDNILTAFPLIIKDVLDEKEYNLDFNEEEIINRELIEKITASKLISSLYSREVLVEDVLSDIDFSRKNMNKKFSEEISFKLKELESIISSSPSDEIEIRENLLTKKEEITNIETSFKALSDYILKQTQAEIKEILDKNMKVFAKLMLVEGIKNESVLKIKNAYNEKIEKLKDVVFVIEEENKILNNDTMPE